MTTSAKARNIAINSDTFTKLAKRAVTGFVCKVLQKERVHRALEADMEVMRIIAEGGHVIVTGLNEKRLATAQTELGSAATVIKNDAADPAAVQMLVDEVKAVGKLDGAWLNAAFAALGAPEEMDAAAFDSMMAANVRGPMFRLRNCQRCLHRGPLWC